MHTGTLDDILEFCFSREGVRFRDVAEQRVDKFETHQRSFQNWKHGGSRDSNDPWRW